MKRSGRGDLLCSRASHSCDARCGKLACMPRVCYAPRCVCSSIEGKANGGLDQEARYERRTARIYSHRIRVLYVTRVLHSYDEGYLLYVARVLNEGTQCFGSRRSLRRTAKEPTT